MREVQIAVFLLGFTVPALVAQPPAPDPRLRTAQQLIGQQKFAQAEDLLEKVVADDPQSGPGWMLLGSARHSQRKFAAAALDAHQKAAEFPRLKPVALYNIACVHALNGEVEKAIGQLQAARAAGFDDRGQFLNDSDLDSLRGDQRFTALIPPLLTGQGLFVEPTRILLALDGENANDEFGWVARKAGDLDGDGATDFVATAPGFQNHAGKIYAYSSRTGKLLFTRTGQRGHRYGHCVAAAGDVNADGVPDVIVGGPAAAGGVAEVLSGKDGTVLRSVRGEHAGGQFGFKVCGLGDLNGDGHADFAVTAMDSGGQPPRRGRCIGYSGNDGSVLFTLDGESSGDKFGSAVAATTDPNHRLLALGAQDAGPQQRGRVYLYRFKGITPERVFTRDAEPTGRDLGQYFLSFPGDLNRDGVPDLYGSDFGDSAKAPGGGRVSIFSGTDGKILLTIAGNQPGEGLGTSPSDAGDVDGDGIGDLVIGAWQNRSGAISGGKVYLHSGATGNLLAAWTCRQRGDTFGFDATGLGDVDADGHADFLLTSAWSPVRGAKTGRVFVIAGSGKPR